MGDEQNYPEDKYPQIRFLGDIRDKKDYLELLMRRYSYSRGSFKQVPAAEYNPMEFIRTNVIGFENVIQACLDNNVKMLFLKY